VKYISRPIHLLAEASNNIKKNVYDIVPEKQYKIEDFNILIFNFNRMTLTIANSINDIKEKSILERKLLLSEKKNLQIANSLNNAQIQIMQNQINPHFLFNSLNTLTSLARIEHAEKTKTLLEDLSIIIRYGLKKTNNLVTIKEELDILNTYLRIQKIRYEEKIDYEIDCEENLGQIQIPAMLLQPLVENCIVHGLEEKSGKGEIKIIIQKSVDGMIQIEVTDNGKGINKKTLNLIHSQIDKITEYSSEKSKNGLLNVLYRIKLFSPEAVIMIDSSEEKGTSIKFSIPVSL
jgi:sensor histidine kinase YesM